MRRLVILDSCLAVTLAVAHSTPAQSQTSEAPDQVSRDVTGNIGPDGQKPIGGVTAEDVRMLAENVSISQEDARFVFHEGGGALIEYKKRHQDSELFGGVRFRYKPTFEVQLRTTALSKELQDGFKASVGRPYRVLVGGFSEKQLYAKQMRLSEKLLRKKSKDGTNLTFRFETDFEKGDVSLLLQPDDLLSTDLTDIRSEVNIAADPDSKIRTASYAGAPATPTCTIGYAVSRPIGPGVRQGALVTAGHCQDTGQSAYGFSLGNAQDEVCGGQDRQLHITPTNFLWNGFFHPGGSWTQIQAVAGGWYDGQPFARVGKFTSAQGTIRTPGPVAPQVSGGDCGSYSVYGFILDNYTAYAGQKAIGGDSGGPLLLAYFGSWYLAGTTSGQGVVGGIADGVSAWRDVPWPWTPCTLSAPCGTLF